MEFPHLLRQSIRHDLPRAFLRFFVSHRRARVCTPRVTRVRGGRAVHSWWVAAGDRLPRRCGPCADVARGRAARPINQERSDLLTLTTASPHYSANFCRGTCAASSPSRWRRSANAGGKFCRCHPSGGDLAVKFTPTEIPGAFVVDPEPHADERGFFARQWCARELAAMALTQGWRRQACRSTIGAGRCAGCTIKSRRRPKRS